MSSLSSSSQTTLARLTTISKITIALVGAANCIMAIAVPVYLSGPTILDELIGGLSLLEWLVSGSFIALVVSAITISFWLYRAHSNMREAGVTGLRFTPGWSVGWYFIPLANFVMPFLAMKELWQGSHGQAIDESTSAPSILWFWWLAWLAASITSFGDEFTLLDSVGFAATALSAGALFQILGQIEAHQPNMSVDAVFE